MKRVAVVGSGVAGLGAAHALATAGTGCRVTLFEGASCFGGHAHTVDVSLPDALGRPVTHGVDTGFLVYNERTYPQLIALFDRLRVVRAASDMSFSVQVPPAAGGASATPRHGLDAWLSGLQWCGSSLDTVFAQRRNLVSPGFWRMLRDLLRFNRLATRLAEQGDDASLAQPIAEFLDAHRFGPEFREGYLLPMVACIWSCPTQQMLAFPMGSLIRFCHNHGLLQVTDRPQWYTVAGGSREYVRQVIGLLPDARRDTPVLGLTRLGENGQGGVVVYTATGAQVFDEVVLACHSDQALALLGPGAAPAERELLGAIRYHANRAVLHTDEAMMPSRRKAWAAWNYERSAPGREQGPGVCLHYWINRLQPLPWQQTVVVSLNPLREPRCDQVISEHDYAHPVFDLPAVAAQRRLNEIQGRQHVWFCGAWTGYGFHEDGLKSGLSVATAILARQRYAEQADARAADALSPVAELAAGSGSGP